MRTNGFALYRGEGASEAAESASLRVRRYCREAVVAGGGYAEAEGDPPAGEVALAYALEGSGFPLVHGFVEGAGRRERGEYALLRMSAGRLYGKRDPLGTRGLWVVRGGPLTGSYASDYRLLPGGAVLVPPGARPALGGRAREESHSAPPFDEAASELASLLEESVEARVRGHSKVAVSFSGGLDSSIVAHLAARHAEVVLCSAFAAGARDERQSERAAALLGLRLETRVLDEESVSQARSAELPPGEATAMDRALWSIYSAASEVAGGSGARLMLLGQMADELFGGYMKYAAEASKSGQIAAEAMMRSDAEACGSRGFLRDEAACSGSCEVRFPYADERVYSFAGHLPFDYKVRGGERKAVLRAAALKLGLPEELAAEPKKAAQFSSGMARLLR